MEIIDVGGTVPVDAVLEQLVAKGNLQRLLSGHGAACFVLVRPLIARDFFKTLIEHAATIDATTRKHIAFIVFYGDRSRIELRA
jgi:hypothetical protein